MKLSNENHIGVSPNYSEIGLHSELGIETTLASEHVGRKVLSFNPDRHVG